MILDELGIKYKTDKSSHWHNFLNTYEKHFSSLREKKIKLLEIGVSGANSLKVWRDYFPNASRIVGIDIDSNCLNHKEDGYDIFLCNQTDENGLKMLSGTEGPFDIIVDDGSHISEHIIKSFEILFPLLNDGGIYVAEDLHTSYLPQYSPAGTQDAISYFQEKINDINLGGKNINSDICGDRQRQFSRLEGKMDFTDEEMSIDSVHFYKSMVFIYKKILENNSSIEKEFVP